MGATRITCGRSDAHHTLERLQAIKAFVLNVEGTWHNKCAACSGYCESGVDKDAAIRLALLHHQDVHPRNVMAFQLLS